MDGDGGETKSGQVSRERAFVPVTLQSPGKESATCRAQKRDLTGLNTFRLTTIIIVLFAQWTGTSFISKL
jgi:hypothetical protein